MFQVFEAFPELAALEVVDPTVDPQDPQATMSTLAEARLRAYFVDRRPGHMGHPGAMQLEKRLWVFKEHFVVLSEQWEEASPWKRSHLEDLMAALGGREWWAKCRQLRLELALEAGEEITRKAPRL